MEIYQLFHDLKIEYEEIEHQAVYTIEEAFHEDIPSKIDGIECKNLFVKGKSSYYLILLEAHKKANLKELARVMKEPKLSFAKVEELEQILHLNIGSVTPLGIIYDQDHVVTLLLDHELQHQKILVHPNTNTKTVSIDFDDLIKIIHATKHTYKMF